MMELLTYNCAGLKMFSVHQLVATCLVGYLGLFFSVSVNCGSELQRLNRSLLNIFIVCHRASFSSLHKFRGGFTYFSINALHICLDDLDDMHSPTIATYAGIEKSL
jgi:hypothetical protein